LLFLNGFPVFVSVNFKEIRFKILVKLEWFVLIFVSFRLILKVYFIKINLPIILFQVFHDLIPQLRAFLLVVFCYLLRFFLGICGFFNETGKCITFSYFTYWWSGNRLRSLCLWYIRSHWWLSFPACVCIWVLGLNWFVSTLKHQWCSWRFGGLFGKPYSHLVQIFRSDRIFYWYFSPINTFVAWRPILIHFLARLSRKVYIIYLFLIVLTSFWLIIYTCLIITLVIIHNLIWLQWFLLFYATILLLFWILTFWIVNACLLSELVLQQVTDLIFG